MGLAHPGHTRSLTNPGRAYAQQLLAERSTNGRPDAVVEGALFHPQPVDRDHEVDGRPLVTVPGLPEQEPVFAIDRGGHPVDAMALAGVEC